MELPEVFADDLSADRLGEVIRDIELCAEVLDVRLKRRASERADDEALSLRDAMQLLVEGDALGLQVRYVHGGAEWWDTVLRAGGGYRLIRVRPQLA